MACEASGPQGKGCIRTADNRRTTPAPPLSRPKLEVQPGLA